MLTCTVSVHHSQKTHCVVTLGVGRWSRTWVRCDRAAAYQAI
jgi:hypothetical protein